MGPRQAAQMPAQRRRRLTHMYLGQVEGLIARCSYKGKPVTQDMVHQYRKMKDDIFFVAAAAMLEGYGLPRSYAAYLAEKPQYDTMSAYLSGVPGTYGGLAPSETESIFLLVPCEKWKGLSRRLGEITGWLKLMPDDMEPERALRLATFLGRVATPPSSERAILDMRRRCEKSLLRLLDTEGAEDALSDFIELRQYAERMLAPKKEMRKSVPVIKPHNRMRIPGDLKKMIRAEGVNPDHLKRVVLYGLRLTSNKAAIGGKYFMVEAFRRNAERVLKKCEGETARLRDKVEEFLVRHGVIAYYKFGTTVRLNMKDDGQSTQPTELGEALLKVIVGFLNDFQRESAISGQHQAL